MVDSVFLARVFVGIACIPLSRLGLRWIFTPDDIMAELKITAGTITGKNLQRTDIGCAITGTALQMALVALGYKEWAAPLVLSCGFFAVVRSMSIVLDGYEQRLAVVTVIEFLCAGAGIIVHNSIGAK